MIESFAKGITVKGLTIRIRTRLKCFISFILVFRVKGSTLESTPDVQTADLVLIKLTTFVIQISSMC